MADSVRIPLEVNLADLIEQIGDMRREDVMSFLLGVDLHMADYGFTKDLRDALSAALAEEDAVGEQFMAGER